MNSRTVATAPIRAYQRWISAAFPRRCKYHPTCSECAVTSVREFGIARGTVMGVWRLLRCNPFSNGGVDYPADHRLARTRR